MLGEFLAVGMLLGFFALLLLGVPVGITLATSGLVFGFLGFGDGLFNLLPARIYGVVAIVISLAAPVWRQWTRSRMFSATSLRRCASRLFMAR